MRTTVEFDPDTQRAIEAIRRDEGLGVSEAVNELIRRGLTAPRNERQHRAFYSCDSASRFHERADAWLAESLNGTRRVGLPWMSLNAFLRIATNPRATANPLTPADAWEHIDGWLDAQASWIPSPDAVTVRSSGIS